MSHSKQKSVYVMRSVNIFSVSNETVAGQIRRSGSLMGNTVDMSGSI